MTKPDAMRVNLQVGERVRLLSIPEETLRGLSEKDVAFVKSMIGKTMPIMGFDKLGRVELEFSTKELIFHTIWVPPACVRRRAGKPGA